MLSEATFESLRDELGGTVFRHVDGFRAKYFNDHCWSSANQDKMQNAESAAVIDKLAREFVQIDHLDGLVNWLAGFKSIFFEVDCPGLRLESQSISGQGSKFSASICFETSELPAVTGSTRVYGEYHHGNASIVENDSEDFLHFAAHALMIFNSQPARLFLHAFLLRGTFLELWVFDRSGAYSSEVLDLAQDPHLLIQILAGYGTMGSEESGINTFVKNLEPNSEGYVTFDHEKKLYLRQDIIAVPNYLVGLGTTCIAASESADAKSNAVAKFSWRIDTTPEEFDLLKRARERNVKGIIQTLGHQDLVSIADLRHGMQFPSQFINRTLSCVATSPLGFPIRKFTSIRELLEVLGDLVLALRSLYIDGRMLHRDVSIKNLVIAQQSSDESPKGILIDFDMALDLEKARAIEPMVGSDGFMAIGILSGKTHTYRHDLESLFFVFLWLAIANDKEHDDACEILEGLPKTSRLWRWCSMDFHAVGKAKAVDMSPDGFEGILSEFCSEFIPLRQLATELHALLFPLRGGAIFTGTDIENEAIKQLYTSMANAFKRSTCKV